MKECSEELWKQEMRLLLLSYEPELYWSLRTTVRPGVA
jgi:hypothetical protein